MVVGGKHHPASQALLGKWGQGKWGQGANLDKITLQASATPFPHARFGSSGHSACGMKEQTLSIR